MMRSLVPKLRFGEFSGEWEDKRLDEISKIERGKFTPRPRNNPIYYNGTIPFVQTSDVVKSNGKIKNYIQTLNEDGLKVSKKFSKGTILITVAANIGYAGILEIDMACPDSLVGLTVKENYSNYFLNYLLEIEQATMDSLAINNAQKNINIAFLKPYKFSLPKPKEQQKIANTLSSLDNLIEAQKKKVEALKKHKKGLMQQLFPREGEKKPKLRFEGFYGEWEENKLGNIVSYFKGFAFKSRDYSKNGTRIIRVSDMGYDYIKKENNAIYIKKDETEQYKKWKLKRDDVIITTVGSKPPIYDSLVGRSIVVQSKDENALLNQNAVCLRANKNIEQRFLNILFKKCEYITFIESIIRGNANQGSITLENLFQYNILIPKPKEQQKIANCLSSLDNLIEAQNKKIEALNKHKKGLMQQMFVSA